MDLTEKPGRTVLICALLVAATLAAYWPVTGCGFVNYDDNVLITRNAHVAGGWSWANAAWAFRTGMGGNWQPLTWLSHILDAQLFGLRPGWHHLTSLLFHTANGVLLFLLLQRLTGAVWRSAVVAALFALHPLHVESVAWVAERKDVLSAFFFMLTLLAYVRYVQESGVGSRGLGSRIPDAGFPGPAKSVASFPLTPALSPGERENRFPLGDESERLVSAGMRAPGLPLPKGEGRGEGEQSARHTGVAVLAKASRKSGSRSWYFVALVLFALGLMSKPMLVTLPFVLLLLDYWPLGRMQKDECGIMNEEGKPSARRFFILLEKLPFFALSAASCVVTFVTQRASESVYPLAYLSLMQRVGNAVVSCANYLEKTFWPAGLAVFYPLPDKLPAGAVIAAGVVVLGITVWVVWLARSRAHLAVGWFWFLGMLVPVIGLVQVGLQQRADRYTYLPLIGVFLMVVWGVSEAVRRGLGLRGLCTPGPLASVKVDQGTDARPLTPSLSLSEGERVPFRAGEGTAAGLPGFHGTGYLGPVIPWLITGLVLLPCAARTRDQLRHWHDSESLFRRAIAVTPDSWLAHYNLAGCLEELGRFDEALAEYSRAVAIYPDYTHAQNNLGNLLLRKGRVDEAIAHWQKALASQPNSAPIHNNLGNVLLGQGQVDEAIAHLQKALENDPSLASAHNSLGSALLRKGKPDEAITHFQEAIRIRPDFARAHSNLGGVLLRQGRSGEALAQYETALAVQPPNPSVLTTVAWALATSPEAQVRNGPRAVELAQQAEQLTGGQNPAVLETLAAAYAEAGRFAEAVATGQRSLALATVRGGDTGQAESLRARLGLFQAGSAFRDPSLAPRGKTPAPP